jgi:hypothetical protein
LSTDNNNTGASSSGNNNNNNNNEDRLPNRLTDHTFLPTLVRALRYYAATLEDLASNEEGELYEPIVNPFGYYLTDSARKASKFAQKLREDTRDVNVLITEEAEEEYRSIAREALIFYIFDLKTKRELMREEIREDYPRLYPYEQEIARAEIMKESIDEKLESERRKAAGGDRNRER